MALHMFSVNCRCNTQKMSSFSWSGC